MFQDRKDAGEKLARALGKYQSKNALVLAIPGGGVEVGNQVAKHLGADFSLLIARKLPYPDNPEAGFGAVAEDGIGNLEHSGATSCRTKEEQMPTRKATAFWEGTLKKGKGRIQSESGAVEGAYSFASRFQQGQGTNPEELIGAALAGCFSMALASGLAQKGYAPERIQTTAGVTIEKIGKGFAISRIRLQTEAEVPQIDENIFLEQAQTAKDNCPVSKALKGTEISLQAELKSG
ncbi:MAG: OsmC family peroxiredoxin [Candidatus Aminicenantes bacterium]